MSEVCEGILYGRPIENPLKLNMVRQGSVLIYAVWLTFNDCFISSP